MSGSQSGASAKSQKPKAKSLYWHPRTCSRDSAPTAAAHNPVHCSVYVWREMMRILRFMSYVVCIYSLMATLSLAAQPATMRLDYYHTGNATQEMWSFDRVVIEPLPWPGDMAKTIDDSNLGNYFFEVHD